ncbi:MAG: M55 family metallopeptidase [Planctomycetaceae bacterium]|jgi:D-amino peptidase|nr:M55 family metallopeptidase [Planctomycetaceae bacterium]
MISDRYFRLPGQVVLGISLAIAAVAPASTAAAPPRKQPRTVFNDDAQVLAEAPAKDPAPYIKAWLDRESAAVPFSTFVFLACTPDICFYDTKAGEEYGARLKTTDHKYVRAMHSLKQQGTDALRLVTEHMQSRGKEVLAAIRMSDTHHHRLNTFDELCPQFAIDHPEYVIKQPDGRTNETALDYSIAAVRNHRMKIMKEIVTDYPVDGLELNFVRWAKHFPRDKGREKAPIMTRYVERIRRMMDASGRKRKNGKRLTLGVRVPESLHTCWLAGVDIQTWVKNGWIDFVVVSTWNNTDPQLPIDEFARFTRPAGVDTIVTMGNMIGAISAGPPIPRDRGTAQSKKQSPGYVSMLLNTAEARGAAANFYTFGADSISFWNVGIHFGREVTASPEQRKRIEAWTHAVGSPDRVWAGPRTYRFLPMGKGISSRKPPVRNYPWYDEGSSPLGQKNNPTLVFSKKRVGKRLVYPFRMADGRGGETLAGRLRFWVYHAVDADSLRIDINGRRVAADRVRSFPVGKLRGGLPGRRFEIDLAACPPFRGDNLLGLTLANARQRDHDPFMEELEITVKSTTPRKRAAARPDSLKIYIAVDSEGPTMVNEYWARHLKPDSPRLRGFRELLTDDVNAAVRGCFAAGATEVVVKDDGFRDRNVIRDRLDPRARLIASGGPLLHGLDATFAGVLLVGFHAREGAVDSILPHTWSSARRRVYRFNGREAGELAAYAIVAGHDHGVPILMATGCDGLCREAHDWLGKDVVTVSVKRRRSDGKIELDSPGLTRPRITAGARLATKRSGAARPFRTRFPLHVQLKLADPPTTAGYVRWRTDNKPDWPGHRVGPRVIEAWLRSTRHLNL